MSALRGSRALLCALRGSRCRVLLWLSPSTGPGPRLQARSLSTVVGARRGGLYEPLSRGEPLDFGGEEEMAEKMLSCRYFRRFIVNPLLARTVTDCLERGGLVNDGALVFECNPGPGVLTRTLLDVGARVVALESDKAFLPGLQSLSKSLNGQLEVVHCDFFKLDPLGYGPMKPPAMYSAKLFEKLGISEVPWTADVPVKVVGIFSQKNERNMLWKLIYSLYEQISIYRYGRIELNMFISEKEYKKLIAKPGDMRNYKALSVLGQIACDIQLLHMEPWSSFLTSGCGRLSIPRSVYVPNDHLCLVRITPRRNLFTAHLSKLNSATFVLMVKVCLAKRKAKLIDRLNSWSTDSGQSLLQQLEIPEDILTGNLYPEEYKCVFEAMEHSIEFNQSWFFNEVLESTRSTCSLN
ncbi:dimethyladenosine transferase 2, mitochondrial [Rhinatrema bivittatum]|uniref:dimethyladenosine transferase 2, mitochondrial n=1 Tax=Rhinatrema bivittatum TaxID=194408 RepID=UPI00112DC8CE|nr:dimethyladenosine transferase 2, mitochondrial [Rhinatrema bivittatum]